MRRIIVCWDPTGAPLFMESAFRHDPLELRNPRSQNLPMNLGFRIWGSECRGWGFGLLLEPGSRFVMLGGMLEGN